MQPRYLNRFTPLYEVSSTVRFFLRILVLSSSFIIGETKAAKLRWLGHVVRMGEDRAVWRAYSGVPNGRRPSGRPRYRWRDEVQKTLVNSAPSTGRKRFWTEKHGGLWCRMSRFTSSRCATAVTEQISRLRASQSPIAISLQKCPTWTSLDGLKFKGYWDNEGSGVLLNTGQTAYFTLETNTRPRLSGGPLMGEYIFEQMHFHWSVDDFTGCEHVLDGHGYAAECHFVHYNSKYESMEVAVGHADGLAVVGFLLEVVDAPNPKFDKLVEGLEAIQKRDQAVRVTAESLSWMERDDLREGSYVTYKGSLTTPPYTECVTWIIYQKPVEIGTEQLGLLRQLEGLDSKPIERNVRPTQRHPPGHSVIYVKQFKAKL